MKTQKLFWLKYKGDHMECLYKCDSILEIEKFVKDNSIADNKIIDIIKFK